MPELEAAKESGGGGPMLEAIGLVKIHGARRVVDNVDFEVRGGEIVVC